VILPIVRTKIIPAITATLGLALVIAACNGRDPTSTATLTATLTPSTTPALADIPLSQVLRMAEDSQVAEIEVRGDKLTVITRDGQTFTSRKESSVSLLELLAERGIATGGDGIKVRILRP